MSPNRTFLLRLYLAASRRGAGVARRVLERRRAEGKEDAERSGERMGEPGLPRPEGTLAWFHAASVGEAASLLEMLRRLTQARPGLHCLVTTGTVTSAAFLADRLPENCLHQYVPVDVVPWVRRFLDHWRPDVAVWTESELWPAMLYETHARGIPMLLVNARISTRSFRRWRTMGGTAKALLGRFDRILAQDDLAGEQLLLLGADPDRLTVEGSLKEGAAPSALRRGGAGEDRARLQRPACVARGLDPPRRGGGRRRRTQHRPPGAAAPRRLSWRRGIRRVAMPSRNCSALAASAWCSARRARPSGRTPTSIWPIRSARWGSGTGSPRSASSAAAWSTSAATIPSSRRSSAAPSSSARTSATSWTATGGCRTRTRRCWCAPRRSWRRRWWRRWRPDRAAAMAAAAWAACSEGAEVTDAVLAAIGDLLDGKR